MGRRIRGRIALCREKRVRFWYFDVRGQSIVGLGGRTEEVRRTVDDGECDELENWRPFNSVWIL